MVPGLVFCVISTTPWPFFLSALTGSNLSSTIQSASPRSRKNLIFSAFSPSGSYKRSRLATSYFILASRVMRPALASMPSVIWMSPMLSWSSASTLHVEKTAETPSTSNSSLALFRISTLGSAGSQTGKGAWVSRSINTCSGGC